MWREVIRRNRTQKKKKEGVVGTVEAAGGGARFKLPWDGQTGSKLTSPREICGWGKVFRAILKIPLVEFEGGIMASEKSRYYYGKCLVLHLRPRLPYMVYGATFCVVYTTLYLSTALVVDMCVDILHIYGGGWAKYTLPHKK